MHIKTPILLLAGAATTIAALPAAAQQPQTIERRVGRLEQDVRTIQRRVFPDGAPQTLDPEIGAQRPTGAGPSQTGDAIQALTGRVDALEAQLSRVTGQVEEQGYRLRQLEQQIADLRRTQQQAQPEQPFTPEPAAERPPVRPRPSQQTPTPSPAPTPTPTPPTSGDPAEAAYNAGYRLWEARRYGEAQTALTQAADRYPNSRWTSWSRNLAGRAYLDDNKPATAARIFLSNYQTNRRGDRAADSLFYLGEALVRLNRASEACPVYDELEQVFPDMRDYLRTRLPAARTAARCRTGR